MKRLLIAIALATVIPACHGGRQPVIVGVPEPEPAPVPPVAPALIEVGFQTTNFDAFDYAVWLEWQAPSGQWLQSYLFTAYGDYGEGPIPNLELFLAYPWTTYYVLLADPWGNLYDRYPLALPSAGSVDVSFDIVDGYLYRIF